MIEEAYVSFETAKLLKEKGFDVPCNCLWNNPPNGSPYNSICEGIMTYEDIDPAVVHHWYLCPTQQMAMRWLREMYNLHIITIPYAPMDRPPHHPGEADIVYIAQLFRGIIPIDKVGRSIIKLTHEEAVESAIKYCLENLI